MAKRSERGYVAWHPQNGFAMWTLSGSEKIAKHRCSESEPWRYWRTLGWRIRRARIVIY